MSRTEPLLPGHYYHIYNRAVGDDRFFQNEEEYRHFLGMWQSKLSPVAFTFAYCLIPNHFHFMIQVKSVAEICKALKTNTYSYDKIYRKFAGLFGSYALRYNKKHDRLGKLFMLPFKRKMISSPHYYSQLVYYIHRNPLHHGITKDPLDYEFSSYKMIIDDRPAWVYRNAVIQWFGGRENFIQYHKYMCKLPV